ncbi:MAG: ComEC/Rec2 family competence protein [Treponema sp.]|nr:ComEC/Rec2 family competence protein [Treponema sp.]
MVISPLIVAALAAVPAVYLPSIRPILLAAAGLLFCLLLGNFCFSVFRHRLPGAFRSLNPAIIRNSLAAALGIIIGLFSASAIRPFAPGLPVETIHAVKGELLDDPRSFVANPGHGPEEERGMAMMELKETSSGNAVRTSARGRALVYFPSGTMPRVRNFGRGAELYVEGRFLLDDAEFGGGPRFRAASVHVVRAAPALEQLRTAVRSAILSRLKLKTWGGLAAALLLGTRENLEGGLSQSFRDAGLSHILALSGMHLAFLSAMLAFVLKKPLGKKGSVIAGLVFIIFYVFLVGPQPSLVRAAIMYALGSGIVLSGTLRQPLALLGAAFLIQIMWDPPSAHSISFILSYLALGGILVLSGRIEIFLRGRLPSSLAGGIGASAAAFLATAPAVRAFFGVLRPIGLVAGLAAAPLSGGFMALSLFWLCLSPLPFIGMMLEYLLRGLHILMQWSISFFARFPGLKAEFLVVCIVTPLFITGLLVLADRQKRYRNELAPFAS